jgi:hypothetical protein
MKPDFNTIGDAVKHLTEAQKQDYITKLQSIDSIESYNGLFVESPAVFSLLASILVKDVVDGPDILQYKPNFEYFDLFYTMNLPIELGQNIVPVCNHISSKLFLNGNYYVFVTGKKENNNLSFQVSFSLSKSKSVELSS